MPCHPPTMPCDIVLPPPLSRGVNWLSIFYSLSFILCWWWLISSPFSLKVMWSPSPKILAPPQGIINNGSLTKTSCIDFMYYGTNNDTLFLWEVLTWVSMVSIILYNNFLFNLAWSPNWHGQLSYSCTLCEHREIGWFLYDKAFRLHTRTFGKTLCWGMCSGAQRSTRFEFCLRKVWDICHNTQLIHLWVGNFFWCNNLYICKEIVHLRCRIKHQDFIREYNRVI